MTINDQPCSIYFVFRCPVSFIVVDQDEDSVAVKDDVRLRSYHEPTLEDKFDKSQMPRVMQVR